jgi:hypothetical protein
MPSSMPSIDCGFHCLIVLNSLPLSREMLVLYLVATTVSNLFWITNKVGHFLVT